MANNKNNKKTALLFTDRKLLKTWHVLRLMLLTLHWDRTRNRECDTLLFSHPRHPLTRTKIPPPIREQASARARWESNRSYSRCSGFAGVLGVNQDEPLRKILIKNNLMIMIITTFDDGHIIHQCVNSSVTAFIHMWRTIPVGFFSLYSTFIEIITRYCYLRMPSFWFR